MATWTREVTDHDTGEKFVVTLRTPRFQDTIDIEEASYEFQYVDGELRAIPRTSRVRLLRITRLLVDWTRPQALSPDAIAQLESETAQEIEAWILAGPDGKPDEAADTPLPDPASGPERSSDEEKPGDESLSKQTD